jgi:DNA-binding GntR family transcriptional regulator
MLQTLPSAPSLIDQTYRQVLEAIADGTLAPAQRIRQGALADSLGVSRQPVSHALHLLKRQGLVEDSGRQGMRVVPLDPTRILQLYQVREAVDGLAAGLAAERIAAADSDNAVITALRTLVAEGCTFDAATPIPRLVHADTEFHRALYRLSGNPAIEEMTAPLWPHLMRSMAAILPTPGYAAQVWREHATILDRVVAGDAAAARSAACAHARSAATLTAERLRGVEQAA